MISILVKLLILGLLAYSSITVLFNYANSVIEWDPSHPPLVFPPATPDDIRNLLSRLVSTNTSALDTFIIYSCALLIKQTFAIPGSALMNVLGGALYGHWKACALVAVLTTIGSTLCYLLSWLLCGEVIGWMFKRRLESLRLKVQRQSSGDLLALLTSMRLFPLTPNWFLNIGSPHAAVPTWAFVISVFLGGLPYNFITTGAGSLLSELNSIGDILTPSIIIRLSLVSAAAMLMPIVRRRWQSKRKD